MLTKKQLAERMTGLGSSDAPVVLGVSKYKTPAGLFDEKVYGVVPTLDADGVRRCYWGDVLEPIILKETGKRLGVKVRKPKSMFRHATLPWMLANLDGLTDDGLIVECKNMQWPIKGNLTDHPYYYQVQHQLAVMGTQHAFLATLIGGNDLKLYEIEADEQVMRAMVDIEARFWARVEAARKELSHVPAHAHCHQALG